MFTFQTGSMEEARHFAARWLRNPFACMDIAAAFAKVVAGIADDGHENGLLVFTGCGTKRKRQRETAQSCPKPRVKWGAKPPERHGGTVDLSAQCEKETRTRKAGCCANQ